MNDKVDVNEARVKPRSRRMVIGWEDGGESGQEVAGGPTSCHQVDVRAVLARQRD